MVVLVGWFEYKIAVSHNVVKLRMHKPRLVAETLYPLVLHPVKRTKLSRLIQKRPHQGAERARPLPPVATLASGPGAHWGDCRRLRRRKEGATAGQHRGFSHEGPAEAPKAVVPG